MLIAMFAKKFVTDLTRIAVWFLVMFEEFLVKKIGDARSSDAEIGVRV